MSTVCVCDVWTALRVQALLKHTKSESYLVLFSPLPHIEVTTVVLDIFHVSEFPIARFLCMLDTQPCPWTFLSFWRQRFVSSFSALSFAWYHVHRHQSLRTHTHVPTSAACFCALTCLLLPAPIHILHLHPFFASHTRMCLYVDSRHYSYLLSHFRLCSHRRVWRGASSQQAPPCRRWRLSTTQTRRRSTGWSSSLKSTMPPTQLRIRCSLLFLLHLFLSLSFVFFLPPNPCTYFTFALNCGIALACAKGCCLVCVAQLLLIAPLSRVPCIAHH